MAPPQPLIPKALKPGDTIALISPSDRLNETYAPSLSRVISWLESEGFRVRSLWTPPPPPPARLSIATMVAHRLAELREAFMDPEIAGIICNVGGALAGELIPALVADDELTAAIKARPKVFVGSSDITNLHFYLAAQTGLRTFYGPCSLTELSEPGAPLPFTAENLLRAITLAEPLGPIPRSAEYAPRPMEVFFGDPTSTLPSKLVPNPGWTWIRPGKAEGRLFGGCLHIVMRLNGMPSVRPEWDGRIVFLETAFGSDEESGITLEDLRRFFAALVAQDVLVRAAGLVFGRPIGYNDDKSRAEYNRVIAEVLELKGVGRDFPVLAGVDIGHTNPMLTLPYGALARLDSERDEFAVLEAAVE